MQLQALTAILLALGSPAYAGLIKRQNDTSPQNETTSLVNADFANPILSFVPPDGSGGNPTAIAASAAASINGHMISSFNVGGPAQTAIPLAPNPPAATGPLFQDPLATLGITNPNQISAIAASIAASASAAIATAAATGTVPDAIGQTTSQYLYVWCGAEGRREPDRVLTLDFDPNSANYGRVLSQALAPTSGNEPHHCGISSDAQRLVCGGFLSFMRNQADIFVFDVSNPAQPRFIANRNGPLGAVPDEVLPLDDNTFLLTEMGSFSGGTPGRLARLDRDGNLIGEYPPFPPSDFNPHGLDIRKDLNLLVTSDFLDVRTAFNNYAGDPVMRASVRIWNLNTMTMSPYPIRLPEGTGSMELRLFHNNPRGQGYVGGTGSGKLYLFDPPSRTAQFVIDTQALVPWYLRPWVNNKAQMKQISEDDQTLWLLYASDYDKWTRKSGYYSGIAVFDVSNPANPRLKQNLQLPTYAGPHLIHRFGNRILITDYFLNLDNFGKIHLDGDRTVRAFNIQGDGTLVADSRFQVPFSNMIPGLRLRPHGLAMKMA